jgi:hypothetical protein
VPLVGEVFFTARAGRLVSSTFRYRTHYLASAAAFAIDPVLSLHTGAQNVRGLPWALQDCSPGRWGRNLLITKQARAAAHIEHGPSAALTDADYLLGAPCVAWWSSACQALSASVSPCRRVRRRRSGRVHRPAVTLGNGTVDVKWCCQTIISLPMLLTRAVAAQSVTLLDRAQPSVIVNGQGFEPLTVSRHPSARTSSLSPN